MTGLCSELGILYTGAINVPLSVKIDELSELKFSISTIRLPGSYVFRSTRHKKCGRLKNDLPELTKIILLDGEPQGGGAHSKISSMPARKYLVENKNSVEMRWKSILENDPANICYTPEPLPIRKELFSLIAIILQMLNSHQHSYQYLKTIARCLFFLGIMHLRIQLVILYFDDKRRQYVASVKLGKTPLETLKNIPVNIKETRPTFFWVLPSLAKEFPQEYRERNSRKGRSE